MPETKVLNMSEIDPEEVKWLWYPYIPFAKITLVQGDPGEGKTSFILALSSLLTNGKSMPFSENKLSPCNVIYQTAEDGLADTVRPRLDSYEADCKRVYVIDESVNRLSLSDSRLEEVIIKYDAKLLILDPMQAYLGEKVDMNSANKVRPEFESLSKMAERTGCAIVIIGHLNKMSGTKGIYRGLGSVDINGAVRSILLVGKSNENEQQRIVGHLKCNLAPLV